MCISSAVCPELGKNFVVVAGFSGTASCTAPSPGCWSADHPRRRRAGRTELGYERFDRVNTIQEYNVIWKEENLQITQTTQVKNVIQDFS